MANPTKIERRGAQLVVLYDDSSRRIAQPTGQGLWLLSGSGETPPEPGEGGWHHPLGPSWATGKWTTYPGSPDHDAGAVDFPTGVTNPPLYAPCDGEIIWASWEDGPNGGLGNCVITLADDGRGIVYGHLQRIDVAVGQRVKGGTQVGLVGTTGNSTGNHLHLEVRKNRNVWGDWFAAVPYFAGKGVTL